MKNFNILTIGWEPDFIKFFLEPIKDRTGFEFTHGVVGDAARVQFIHRKHPEINTIALSKSRNESLPQPDFDLLASLECNGIPTVKSMIQGDRVLRHRSEQESFGYATLLARKIKEILEKLHPDVVLGSFDSLQSGIGLAVSKSCGIPWVALAFPVIPDNLTGFCNGLTPNCLVPITRHVDAELQKHAEEIIKRVRKGSQKIVAYQAPSSIKQWIRQYIKHTLNLYRRISSNKVLGFDRYTAPTMNERLSDVARRSINSILLPAGRMLEKPTKGSYIYFPFHMAPESMVDTWAPFYQNQLAFVAQISLAMPADMEFVVKLHFSDPDNYSRAQLAKLLNLPRLRIAHPNASGLDFLEKAALVVGIQGTTCMEAALRGKPVLIFGDSPYLNFPRSQRAERPDMLHAQIRRMLEMPPPSSEEIVQAFAAYMARYMPGRINDWGRPIEEDELMRLVDCFHALRSYLSIPGNYENWYRQPPFIDELHGE